MRNIFLLIMLLITTVFNSYAQEPKTKKIKEKVKGFTKTKREYFVLENNLKVRHGSYKEYYKKHLVVNGSFKNGKKEGEWEYNSPDENNLQKGSFTKGEKIGEWKGYIQGELVYESFYNEDYKLQDLKGYDLNGTKVEEYHYDSKSNKGKGFKPLAEDFLLEYETYSNSQKYHGSVKIKYSNGNIFQERKYHKGKLFWVSDIYKKEGGVQRKTNFKDGKGILINYDLVKLKKEDEFLVREAITYKDSLPNGNMSSFNSNGKMISSGYQFKKQKTGPWKIWSKKKQEYITKNHKKLTKKQLTEQYEEVSISSNHQMSFESASKSLEKNLNQRPAVLMENFYKKGRSYNYKKQFSMAVNNFVAANFDIGKFDYLEEGTHRGIAVFKINTLGEVSDIKTRTKNKNIGDHLKEVLEGLPTFIPAFQNHKRVNLLFQLPLVFRVGGKKNQGDPFKNFERKKRNF